MSRRILALLLPLLLALPLAATAQEGVGEGGTPDIEWEEKIAELGTIVQGEEPRIIYRFRNEGDGPLRIRRVRPGCGCTAALLSDERVEPGGEGELEVTLDTRRRMGHQDLRVVVWSNDPSESDQGTFTSVLNLRGEIVTLYETTPAAAYFDPFRAGESPEQTLTLLPKEGADDFEVTGIDSPSRYIETSHEPFRHADRRGARLTVSIADDAPPGRIEATLMVQTTLERQPEVRVPVIATVHGPIIWYPDRIPFYVIQKGNEVEKTFTLERVAEGEGVPIDRVEAAPSIFTVDVREVVAGRRYEVALRVRADAPPGLFHEPVRVHLDHPEMPVVEIPTFGEVTRQVVCRPAGVWFETTPDAPGVLRTLHVERPDGGPLEVTDASTDAEGIEVSISSPEEDIWEVEVRAPDGLSPGDLEGEIVLETTVGGEETVTLPIRGRVAP